ncbi:Protein-arginine-phosphatase [Moorella humiferrea]|uniref:low molecular weight protein arginine phosphatase n=1 Tax=Neomoorella humiferrea TaxID=676965 RepID=UPI0030CB9059
MPGILFICTGNTCRSSMAAAIARRLNEERGFNIAIASAGLAAREGDPATAEAVQAVAEMGIELGDHRARRVTEEMIEDAELILTMTRAHKELLLYLYPAARDKTYTLKEYVRLEGGENGEDYDIPDPIGGSLEVYRATAAVLAELVGQALEKFVRDQKGTSA